MKIAVLGWGSLLWDTESTKGKEFEKHLERCSGADGLWCEGGPTLRLEFSRISDSRSGALTLVLDYENGTQCQVGYRISARDDPEDAVCDLRQREGTRRDRIGLYLAGEEETTRWARAHADAQEEIRKWAKSTGIEAVVWTALQSNFAERASVSFSMETAMKWIKNGGPEGRRKAVEYISRAPAFVKTDLRDRLQVEPWFRKI